MATVDRSGAFNSVLAELRAAINAAETQAQQLKESYSLPADVLAQLQTKAMSGELGGDMQSAAQLVGSGAETWPNLFSGKSANSGLIKSHLNRMIAENQGAIRAAVAADPACQRPV